MSFKSRKSSQYPHEKSTHSITHRQPRRDSFVHKLQKQLERARLQQWHISTGNRLAYSQTSTGSAKHMAPGQEARLIDID